MKEIIIIGKGDLGKRAMDNAVSIGYTVFLFEKEQDVRQPPEPLPIYNIDPVSVSLDGKPMSK